MKMRPSRLKLYERVLRMWMGSQALLYLPAPPAHQRIFYGDDPSQFGDLYLTGAIGPHPVVILVHGGFWRTAYSLEHAGHIAAALAQAGIACWSLEYRRIGNPGGGWPGTLQDIARGAAHLRHLAAEHSLDLGRVVVAGHSAGGQLALWLAGAPHLPPECELAARDLPPLRGVVSLAGVCDLRRAYELELSNMVVKEYLGGSPQECPERYALASPIERLPLGIPQLLLHGVSDQIVPLEISERYAIAARASGDLVELITLDGIGHFEVIDPASPAWPALLDNLLRLLA